MIPLDKSLLRKEVRGRISRLSPTEKQAGSSSVCEALRKHISASGARVVALFAPLPDEPQIWPLVEELSSRMLVVLPRIESEVMRFYPYSGVVLPGAYGIMEPSANDAVASCDIDLIVVPGVAFTENGARMGRGKGFYDRYLSLEDFRGVKIGVCYRVQVVDAIPLEEHDVKMDRVIYG